MKILNRWFSWKLSFSFSVLFFFFLGKTRPIQSIFHSLEINSRFKPLKTQTDESSTSYFCYTCCGEETCTNQQNQHQYNFLHWICCFIIHKIFFASTTAAAAAAAAIFFIFIFYFHYSLFRSHRLHLF